MLIWLAVAAVSLLAGQSALPQLLLTVGKLTTQLPERSLLPDQRLRHLIEQARRALLNVLLDPGFGIRIARSCLRGRPLKMLEQVVDSLLILLVHM